MPLILNLVVSQRELLFLEKNFFGIYSVKELLII